MNNYLDQFAKKCGLLGMLLTFGAIIARVLGQHRVFEVEAMTFLIGGIALMVASCAIQLNFLNKPK